MKLLQNRPLLKELFFASNTEKIRMTNEEFVKIASQQDGGSHVDPTIDFGYQFANEGILIEGLPPKSFKTDNFGKSCSKIRQGTNSDY